MNGVNKTLYIPLYGKSYVSGKGLFLADKKAEEIWAAEGFSLKGKSRSKWLAYYLGIRAAVFDEWLRERLAQARSGVVIHIGCGMDSRVARVGAAHCRWYDVDFPEVIAERRRYFTESANYQMVAADARDCKWLAKIKERDLAFVVMEGVSMYLSVEEMKSLANNLCAHFNRISLLVDSYTSLAARMSRLRNPIKAVGATQVHGVDGPLSYQSGSLLFVKEHPMIPQKYLDELKGLEKFILAKLYAGAFSQKLYRLFEYKGGE